MSKQVLITGATGFLGSHLLSLLCRHNYQVTVIKRSWSDTWRIKPFLPQIETYDIDLVSLDNIFRNHQFQAVIHLATNYKKYHQIDEIDSLCADNIAFPTRVLETAIEYGVKIFLNTGTFFEYSNSQDPIDPDNYQQDCFNLYALTKSSFENILKSYVQKNNFKATTFRIFSPFGPADQEYRLIPWIIKNALAGKQINLSEGYQKLDFIYISDLAQAYFNCLKFIDNFEDNYNVFNLGSGQPHSLRDLVSSIENCLGKPVNKVWGQKVKNDYEIIYADISKNQNLLKWRPQVTFDEGIRRTVQYYSNKEK